MATNYPTTTKPTIPSHEDLVAKLTDTEDSFVERKSKGDKGGWLRTAVAFTNSLPIGYPGVLFIGVSDSGQIGDNGNLEDIIKSFSDVIANSAWPPIYSVPHILTHEGKSCIAVIIPGSDSRPHFAGRAYVRDGTQTKDASEEQFSRLIAQRNSKARLILQSKGKPVTIERIQNRGTHNVQRGYSIGTVADCNQFFVTIMTGGKPSLSIPLAWLELSHDHNSNQLKILVEENG